MYTCQIIATQSLGFLIHVIGKAGVSMYQFTFGFSMNVIFCLPLLSLRTILKINTAIATTFYKFLEHITRKDSSSYLKRVLIAKFDS